MKIVQSYPTLCDPKDYTEFEQIPGNCEGQGRLACCSSWGHNESGVAEEQQQTSSDRLKSPCKKGGVSKHLV